MTLKKLVKEFAAYLGTNDSLIDRDYKHISEKIELHWGYEEFYPLINNLLINNRGVNRDGFPPEVIQELYELSEIHDNLFPKKMR